MTRFSSTSVVLLSIALGAVGCAEAPDAAKVGEISVPLTAAGSSGAVYHLPPGTSLSLFNDPVLASFSLDGDAPSVTVSVSPGTYSALLFTQSGVPDTWPLIRQNADGTTETVQATLDPIPSVTVVADQTVPLTIHFHAAPAGGGITFQTGAVQVMIDVDDVPPFEFTIDMPSLTTTFIDTSEATPPVLPSRLPALGSAGQSYRVVARTTGRWTIGADATVCVPVTTAFEASGQQLFVDLLAETTGSVAVQLCLSQVGTSVGLDLNFFRSGTPLTPLLSDLTTREVDVLYVAEAIVDAANVFDGTTLRLDRLTGTRSGTGLVFGDIQALRSDNTFERWFDIEEDGAATVTLSPL
jgi:hypothetical protein